MLRIDDPANLRSSLFENEVATLAKPGSLHHLVRLGLTPTAVHVQDEFTHDVVVPVREGHVYAVYDST